MEKVLKLKKIKGDPFVVVLLIIFYFPIFRNISESSSTSQTFLNFVFLTIAIYFTPKSQSLAAFRSIWVSLLFSAITLSVFILSLAYESPLARTLSDVGRLVLLFTFIQTGQRFLDTKPTTQVHISESLVFACLTSVPFSLLVFFEPLWPLVDIFKGRLSDDELSFHFLRASGFSGYPTDYGCLLILGAILVYNLKKIGHISLPRAAFCYGVLAAGLILSAARGAIIQLVGLSIVYVIGGLFSTSTLRRRSSAYILIAALTSAFLFKTVVLEQSEGAQSELTYASYLIDSAVNPDDSILHRFTEIERSIDIILGDRRIPEGTDRVEPFELDVIESAIGHYTIRYGFLGVTLYLLLTLTLIASIDRKVTNPLGRALFFWLLSFVIFVAPFSDVMSRLKGLALYGLLIGFCLKRET